MQCYEIRAVELAAILDELGGRCIWFSYDERGRSNLFVQKTAVDENGLAPNSILAKVSDLGHCLEWQPPEDANERDKLKKTSV